MSLVEVLLLINTVAVLFLLLVFFAGLVMLFRYYTVIVQMQKKFDMVSNDVEKEVMPTIQEARNAIIGFKNLLDALTGVIGHYAIIGGITKFSPKWGSRLAGYKMGINIAYKLLNTFMGTRGGGKGNRKNGEI